MLPCTLGRLTYLYLGLLKKKAPVGPLRQVCRSLYAVYLKSPEALNFLSNGEAPPVAPGPLAYNEIGMFGVIAVVLAGWATANPTTYRAELAFQAILPKTSTFWGTIIARTVATIAGLFPAFTMKLLGFVALYEFILAPFGSDYRI